MSKFTSRRGQRGFTLIELMIVVAVVAILASIAYPAYGDAVRKSRRGQAKADLLEAAQMAERFHTVNGTFEGFSLPTALRTSPQSGAGTARYDVGVTGATADAYTLEAVPITGAGQDKDTKCMTLTLDQAGVKHSTGTDTGNCW